MVSTERIAPCGRGSESLPSRDRRERSSELACVILLTALGVHAGVVQGTVQEFASGYSLSRTSVRLVPVPRADNIDLKQMQQRTGPAGQFVFFNVPDGYYFLISTRNGYFPGAYGQRRPNGQGAPILVTKDSDLFAQLRMHRKGAITGRVLDENGVGIEGVPVVAYRAHLPLRVVAQGTSDDRGVYRIHGLDAGKYWVRSTAHTLEDGSGMLPTFGPKDWMVMLPILSMLSEGSPTGDCGFEVISFQCHPAAFTRASFRRVGEKMWFQMPE